MNKLSAKSPHGKRRIEHVFGFEQTGDCRFANGKRSQDEGAMRYRLVARRNRPASKGCGFAGNQRLFVCETGHRLPLHLPEMPKPMGGKVKPEKHALTASPVHGKPTALKVTMREAPP
jgi:hypothetical protein